MPVKAKIYYYPAHLGHIAIEIIDTIDPIDPKKKAYYSTTILPNSHDAVDVQEFYTGLATDDLGSGFCRGVDIANKASEGVLVVELPPVNLNTTLLPYEDLIFDYKILSNNCANFVAKILKDLGYHDNASVAKKWLLRPIDIYRSVLKIPGASVSRLELSKEDFFANIDFCINKYEFYVNRNPNVPDNEKLNFNFFLKAVGTQVFQCRTNDTKCADLTKQIEKSFITYFGNNPQAYWKQYRDGLCDAARLLDDYEYVANIEPPTDSYSRWDNRLSLFNYLALTLVAFVIVFATSPTMFLVAFCIASVTALSNFIYNLFVAVNTKAAQRKNALLNSIPSFLTFLLMGAAIYGNVFGASSFNSIFGLWVAPLGFSVIITWFVYLALQWSIPKIQFPLTALTFAISAYLFFLPLNYDLGVMAPSIVTSLYVVGIVASLIVLKKLLFDLNVLGRGSLFSSSQAAINAGEINAVTEGFRSCTQSSTAEHSIPLAPNTIGSSTSATNNAQGENTLRVNNS